jgi:hypothetical protein
MVLRMQMEVDLRFAGPPQRSHRGISERKELDTEDLDNEDCDGDDAVHRNFRVADEAAGAVAHGAIACPITVTSTLTSILRPRRWD